VADENLAIMKEMPNGRHKNAAEPQKNDQFRYWQI
jgi:hypothetical protein